MRRLLAILVALAILRAVGAETTTQVFVENGQPVKLNKNALLGTTQTVDGCYVVNSAKPASADEFGAHYISIGLLAEPVLAAGDYHVTMKLGLRRTSAEPTPITVSVKIGRHWHDLVLEEGRITVKGVLLDAVRYERIELTHLLPVTLDGSPFTLDFERRNGELEIRCNDQLLQRLWIEPSPGDLGIAVERKQLLRVASSTDDIEAELRIYDWRATAEFLVASEARRRWEQSAGATWRLMKRVGDAYAYVEDDPKLPNVLIIGDSISIYYTDPVRRLLSGHADVYRTPMGPGKAETLFASLDDFLRQYHWDIIHFNSGLHDFARKQGTEEELAEYRKNLQIIVGKLKATGARLIWASTTPVPQSVPASTSSDEVARKYNAVAKELMDENNIPINDLHSAILPDHSRYWLAPNNIHFNEEGSAFLGRKVANAVLAEMEKARTELSR